VSGCFVTRIMGVLLRLGGEACRLILVRPHSPFMTTYDRADWHYSGSFPPSQPRENGGSHIGFFLAWAICNELESELLRTESQNAVAACERARLRVLGFFLTSAMKS
jgi:hypothetical protein